MRHGKSEETNYLTKMRGVQKESMKIKEDILAILAECTTTGNVLYLPDRQLDRPTYEAVNKCLTNIGGKWNRSAKGHMFDYEPAEALENLIFTGETEDMKKTFQFFPTPRPVAEMMCDMAELTPDSYVLEPSGGKGDLADVIWERHPAYLFCSELNKDMGRYLADREYHTQTGMDFLRFESDGDWTQIIMNPPFARQQDIDHIYKAFDILNSGGVLVSVISVAPFFRTNRKSVEFRAWLVDVGAEITDLPEGAFKDSGTMVRARIIKIRKGDRTQSGRQ